MRRYSLQFYCIWIIVLLVAIVLEMTFIPKIIRDKLKKPSSVLEPPDVQTRPVPEEYGESEHYGVGVYYSNWSPYEPRLHFPHDIDLKKVTRINYAFFIVDSSSGKIKSSDDWSDFKMDIKYQGKPDRVTGALGELNYLKLQPENDFKLIMAVGGWSNREAFHKIVKSEKKMSNFITSCLDTMFEYGFDGIDLDWEFPKDDGVEPAKYLEMCARLREGMDELENKIWGPERMSKPRFELSMATPAFAQSLEILPIPEMDKYICVWNMMTYDFHGSWSKRTGYHSNLYNLTNNPDKTVDKRRFEDLGIEELDGLNSHEAVMIMIEKFGVNPRKINLGMAAYGRGFTKVQNDGDNYLERPYSGVGGLSEGEPGIWLYNQLPIKNSTEKFDDTWVSAYCFDPETRTFVGYDNIESMKIKQEYVMKHKLAGGFWWESCGDDHKDPERNLVNAFTEDMKLARVASAYKEEELMNYYLQKYPDGFLSQQFRGHLNKRRSNK